MDEIKFCPPTFEEILQINAKDYKMLGSVCILFLADRILSLGPRYEDKVREMVAFLEEKRYANVPLKAKYSKRNINMVNYIMETK